MDRNLHTDDFERLLREKSDEFRMYPSKRVWCSIYNNIHPGNKWPSVAMCITLISALLLVGYLNTRNTNQYSSIAKNTMPQLTASNSTAALKTLTVSASSNSVIAKASSSVTKFVNSNQNSLPITSSKAGGNKVQIKHNLSVASSAINLPRESAGTNIAIGTTKARLSDYHNNTISKQNSAIDINVINNSFNNLASGTDNPEQLSKISSGEINDFTTENSDLDQKISISHSFPVFTPGQLNTLFNTDNADTKISIRKITAEIEESMIGSSKKNLISPVDKEWIDNYALYNRPAPKKWANKLTLQMYATPSVVYRNLYDDANFGSTLNATPFAISSSNRDLNASVNQTPSFGFEVGTGLQYAIFKGVKLKSSLQLNYTRYNSHAFQNSHPVATKLTMHNFETNTSYEVFKSTAYSNNSGLEIANLHNETFQISLPVGIDLKLLGNEYLEWNIGATIQPTFVAGGKSFLISSDRHNYVKETSMLNRWNLNAGFETFIAYKVNGLTWQIGPQFRKQLFSTNSKTYAVEERLVNYGLKIGVIKTIK